MVNPINSSIIRRIRTTNFVNDYRINVDLGLEIDWDKISSFNYYVIGMSNVVIGNNKRVYLGYYKGLFDDPDLSGSSEDPYGIITTTSSPVLSNKILVDIGSNKNTGNNPLDIASDNIVFPQNLIGTAPADNSSVLNANKYSTVNDDLYISGINIGEASIKNWRGIRRKFNFTGSFTGSDGTLGIRLEFYDVYRDTDKTYYLVLNFFDNNFRDQHFTMIELGRKDEDFNYLDLYNSLFLPKTNMGFLPLDIDGMETFERDNLNSNMYIMSKWNKLASTLEMKLEEQTNEISKEGY